MKPVARRDWKLRCQQAPAEQTVQQFADQLNLSPLTARALLQRGLAETGSAGQFLNDRLKDLPDPALLPAMEKACERIEQALRDRELICIHGDYDVDGISGCTLLVETLRALGGKVGYHIPLRLKDGYGLSAEAIENDAKSAVALLISVDCGVSAQAEAELAAQLGLDLIITDHHQPPETLPPCLALVNPHLPDNRFPWPDLSGVGVAFFLLLGLRRRLRENGYFNDRSEPDLRQGLDLVALGTIADLVPLGGINRILARTGLELLEQGGRVGVAALKQVAEVKAVSAGSVGFRLAPRLNAAGRLEDAALGVELLLTDDANEARRIALLLDRFNRERQQIEAKTLHQAEEAVAALADDRYSIVLAEEGWHSGVIGIVASRLVERYYRPVVMIALDGGQGKGSCRSISDFHLYQALQRCSAPLSGYGGHAMAAGLSVAGERIDEFAADFEAVARDLLQPEQLVPQLAHDGICQLAELSLAQVQELERLQPFGIGNPQPAFVARNCQLSGLRVLAEKHLKFTAEQQDCRIDCIAFSMAERYDELAGEVDLLFKPTINSWRGRDSVQLQLIDLRPS